MELGPGGLSWVFEDLFFKSTYVVSRYFSVICAWFLKIQLFLKDICLCFKTLPFPNRMLFCRVAFCIQACCGTYAIWPLVLMQPFNRIISPNMAFNSEDLPEPTWPTTATSCPGLTCRLTLSEIRLLKRKLYYYINYKKSHLYNFSYIKSYKKFLKNIIVSSTSTFWIFRECEPSLNRYYFSAVSSPCISQTITT